METAFVAADARFQVDALPAHQGCFFSRRGHPLDGRLGVTLPELVQFPMVGVRMPPRAIAPGRSSHLSLDPVTGDVIPHIATTSFAAAKAIIARTDGIGIAAPVQLIEDIERGALAILDADATSAEVRLRHRVPARPVAVARRSGIPRDAEGSRGGAWRPRLRRSSRRARAPGLPRSASADRSLSGRCAVRRSSRAVAVDPARPLGGESRFPEGASAMTNNRRAFVQSLAAAALAAALFPAPATAQSGGAYPNRPIKLVVAYPPGGGADLTADTVAQKMSEQMGPAGGGGEQARRRLEHRRRPGGQGRARRLHAAAGHHRQATNKSIYTNLTYDTLRDFAPVTQTMSRRACWW